MLFYYFCPKNIKMEFYQQQLTLLTKEFNQFQSKYRLYTILRLISFLTTVLFTYLFRESYIVYIILFLGLSTFLYTVSRSVYFKTLRDKKRIHIEINERELASLKGDRSQFDSGNEFKNSNHPYISDMDVFGENSVFQNINRTTSKEGKRKLADILKYGSDSIQFNEKMIAFLAEKMTWNQLFMVEGTYSKKQIGNDISLLELEKIEVKENSLSFLRIALPIIIIVSIFCFNLNLIPNFLFSLILFLPMILVSMVLKVNNKNAAILEKLEDRISTLKHQIDLLKEWKDEVIDEKDWKSILFETNESLEANINELNKIKNGFEFRKNILVGIILNVLFLWDFHLQHKLNSWIRKNTENLKKWESNIADVEIWISGAVFFYNNKDRAVFNEFSKNKEFDIQDLAHPNVLKEKVVTNSFTLNSEEYLAVITGPNMAGKSTFLRSVGIAIVFANAGFPIIAKSSVLPKMKLYSSMRTSDDLAQESSYFHAELKRLRFIMDAIENGEEVFVILDEILKGTNSKDKEQGSIMFLEKLRTLNTKGIIATHDLALCELEKNKNGFKNLYFDSKIIENELYFDYKMNDGICQNMNASFLLKKMKLV